MTRRSDQGSLTDCDLYKEKPGPLFRREFETPHGPSLSSARIYVSGLGYFKCYVNGQRVGDSELDPAFTNVEKRVFYRTFNVTQLILQNGGTRHVLGIELGNGWFNPLPLRFWGAHNLRDSLRVGAPMFKLNLVLRFNDGICQLSFYRRRFAVKT